MGNEIQDENLVPLDLLFGYPKRNAPKVSPDGKKLAFLAPSDKNVSNVWVASLDATDATMITHDSNRGIQGASNFRWTEDSKYILYTQDVGGDENWNLWLQPLDGSPARNLTPHEGVRVENFMLDDKYPDEVLVSMNLRDKSLFDVSRIAISSGKAKLDTENPGDVVKFKTDSKFQIRAALAKIPETSQGMLRVRESVESPWQDVLVWEKSDSLDFVSFADEGASVIVQISVGSDKVRLVKLDAKNGKVLKEIAADDKTDVSSILHNPEDHSVLAVSFDYLMPTWHVVDEKVAADIEKLKKLEEGVFAVTSQSEDNKIWTVECIRGDKPPVFYVYNRESKTARKLFVTMPELEQYPLGKMKGVEFKSRDGLTIPCYLTLPLLKDGQEAKNLPMVLLPHGGPWWRDSWGMSSGGGARFWPWMLASRGYAVLQPNFRGSTGYGKAFLNAGDRGWGVGFMQHDLTDAVQWAISTGLADPKRVAIMGGSYGGYATLAGLTFTPELYCAGVDLVGPSNVATLYASFPKYWLAIKKMFTDRTGDAEHDEELNHRISPLFHIDNIRAPLLIGQGANDPRVVKAESDQIFEAMKAKGLPVEYIVYPDEGHGFARPPNHLDFMSRTEQFLAKHLGGLSMAPITCEGACVEVM